MLKPQLLSKREEIADNIWWQFAMSHFIPKVKYAFVRVIVIITDCYLFEITGT